MASNNSPTYKRFITGEIPRFDQKNDMFKRARWDPEMIPHGNKFYGSHHPKNKPGYQLEDLALVSSAWFVERGFARGNMGGNWGLLSWDLSQPGISRVPEGLKLEAKSSGHISRLVKRAAVTFGASAVGICELNRRWLYSKYYHPATKEHAPLELKEEYRYAIVIALEMDYEMIQTSPCHVSGATCGLGYSRMPFVAGLLAQFIRDLGYNAIPCGNDTTLSIPLAVDAGLGELGRNGLLITAKFGPRVRLAKVFTDLPLEPDPPVDLGVQDFCEKCEKCAEKCPAQAIMYGDRTDQPLSISNNRGVLKWPLNAEKCFKYWAANRSDCASCIRTCPFNKPAGKVHDLTRWLIPRAPWLNKTFVWIDDLLGYGKQADAQAFWH